MSTYKARINQALRGYEPTTLVLGTAAAVVALWAGAKIAKDPKRT